METCLIGISAIGGSDVQFASLTETVKPDLGEKDIESIPLVNGGRVTKFNPEGDSSITFEAYPFQAGTDTGTTGKGFFDLLHAQDASVPIRVTNTRARTKYRVLVLWTNDPTPTTAQAATAQNYSALRIGLADGYFTSVQPDFTDGMLKFTVVYKCAPYDKAAASCVMMESAAGTTAGDVLPAIAAYTTSNKFA
jgi:hypothetical protein